MIRRCSWCGVRLRVWQRRTCRTCTRVERSHSHAGKGAPWVPRDARRNEPADRIGP